MNTGLLILGGIALTAGAVALAKSAAPVKSSGGSLGGATFNGKLYTDESITEGELAEAASHGDKAAADELGRRQMITTVHGWCGAVGLGSQCDDYVKAGLDVANAISKAVSDDLAADANTPEQKARLASAVGRIVSLGYPPTRFNSLLEFGVEEQAATIEEDIRTIEHGPTFTAPFMGVISVSSMLHDAGRAAIETAAKGGAVADTLNKLFGKIAARRSPVGCLRTERPVYFYDHPVSGASLVTVADAEWSSGNHAMLAYLACAAAGKYGLSLSRAYEVAAANAEHFNDRHGIASRAESLGTSVLIAGYPLSDCGPLILSEAWFALLKEAGHTPAPTGLLVTVKGFDPFKRS